MIFTSGFASDVWMQLEPGILAPSTADLIGAPRMTEYSVEPLAIQTLTRKGPTWRQDTYQTLQSAVTIKLRFELRLTDMVAALLTALLPLTSSETDGLVMRTILEPDLMDPVNTFKLWLKDARTGQVYFHEGCAVSEAEITIQSRNIPTIIFGIIALKTTPILDGTPILDSDGNPILDSDGNPILDGSGTLPALPAITPAYQPQFCHVFFTTADSFTSNLFASELIGVTRATALIQRDLAPAMFRGPTGQRFTKSAAEISGTIDLQVLSSWRQLLYLPEIAGRIILRFGQDAMANWIDVGLVKAALTLAETQVQSVSDTVTTTFQIEPIAGPTVALTKPAPPPSTLDFCGVQNNWNLPDNLPYTNAGDNLTGFRPGFGNAFDELGTDGTNLTANAGNGWLALPAQAGGDFKVEFDIQENGPFVDGYIMFVDSALERGYGFRFSAQGTDTPDCMIGTCCLWNQAGSYPQYDGSGFFAPVPQVDEETEDLPLGEFRHIVLTRISGVFTLQVGSQTLASWDSQSFVTGTIGIGYYFGDDSGGSSVFFKNISITHI